MAITAKIKYLLDISGKKQADIMEVLDLASKQVVSNKMKRESWSAEDLIKIAEFTHSKLMIVTENGEQIIF